MTVLMMTQMVLLLTITVADLNDQASFTSSDAVNVAEGATAVVTLATDTDTADSGGLAYAIVTDDQLQGHSSL